MEKYPVFIDGAECGSLSVSAEGLLTKLEAKCRHSEGLVRLYIFGSGKSAYLGVMQPENGTLHITKKLSRTQMKSLPDKIEYAADKPILKQESAPKQPESDDKLWFQTPQGILISSDGRQSLIAIPSDMPQTRHTKRMLRYINGKQYAVFPGKRNLPEK